MVALTLADVDNFERLVKHVEISEFKMTLQTTAGIWRMSMMFDNDRGASGYSASGSTLSEVLQNMVDNFGSAAVTVLKPDTIENAVRLPAMHTYPDPELLRRSGMYVAAEEAQRLRRFDNGLVPGEKILGSRTGRLAVTPLPEQVMPRPDGMAEYIDRMGDNAHDDDPDIF